jgi:hypothetical protein
VRGVQKTSRSASDGRGVSSRRNASSNILTIRLLGRDAEARAALAVLQQLQPDSTITRNKEDRGYRVANPEFHRLIERYLDGLRKAGLPE